MHRKIRGNSGQTIIEEKLMGEKQAMLLFVGSLNCVRHKPYREIGALMQQGRAAMLCPSMSDFATGRYLNQVRDALKELSETKGIRRFVIAYGCQWVILSTDGELLIREMREEQNIDVEIFDDSHLEFGDHGGKEYCL